MKSLRTQAVFAAFLTLASLSVNHAVGQYAFNFTGNQTYSENFDSMGTGTTFPTGWSAVRGAGSGTLWQSLTLSANTGIANSGGVYNLSTNASNTDRAFGSLASGSLVPYFGAIFTNSTGGIITNINLSGFHEQWRLGNNAAVETTVFEYSLNSTGLTNGTWTAISGMDLVEIQSGNNANTAIDGNLSGNRVAISGTASSLTWADKSTMWIRWRDADATGSDGIYAVDDFSMTVAFQPPGTPPSVVSLTPASIDTNAGGSATFTLTTAGDPATNFWYKVTPIATPTATNLIAVTAAAGNTLALVNLIKANEAAYFVIISNNFGMATSSLVTLTVVDPYISSQPASQPGLLGGDVSFGVSALGTSLTYQWYYCADPSDNTQITSAVADGALAGGSIASGAATATLSVTNIQFADATNFVVVVTGSGGVITSSVASLTVSDLNVPLAFWTFNGSSVNTTNPATFQGIGTASSTNVSTFLQLTANADGTDSTPLSPNNAWGSSTYPAQSTLNKQAGVRFNTSTIGAKNIGVSFSTRGTTQTSKYYRLQYTTNGTDFVDYPSSASIPGANSYYNSPAFSLSGFPGVANNPNFGVRVVSEFEGTAKYNNIVSNVYSGLTAAYSSSATFSFDLVKITADSITNGNAAPVISTLSDLTVTDGGSLATNTFTISDDVTPAGSLSVSATSLYGPITPSITIDNNAGTVKLIVSTSLANGSTNYAPIQVTVTDGNNDVATKWFTLVIKPSDTAPSITGLNNTNMLTNSTLVIPFTVFDENIPGLTLDVQATNINSLVTTLPTANVVLGGSGANRTLTITPSAGQSGTAPITVTAFDGVNTTTTTIFLTVRENTGLLLVEKFKYDSSGSVNLQSGGFWSSHGGTPNQLLVGTPGYITIDGLTGNEDINAPIIGAPYLTNTAAILYAKFDINYQVLPDNTGAYFAHFKDNSTFGFYARTWASTNGTTTPGSYRIGIGNSSSATAISAQVPQDLLTNVTYTIVTRLLLTNGICTVWVNPTSAADLGVSAHDSTNSIGSVTNLNHVTSFAFRQSNTSEGKLVVSNIVVGTSFTAVTGLAPILSVYSIADNKAVLTWTDSSYGLQAAPAPDGTFTNVPSATSPFTNTTTVDATKFYRLKK